MGIFDWLTGSNSDQQTSTSTGTNTTGTSVGTSEQSGTTNNNTSSNSAVDSVSGTNASTTNNQNTAQNINQSTSQATTSQSHQQVEGSTLSQNELDTLDKAAALVSGDTTALTGNPTSGTASQLATALAQRAGNTPDVYKALAGAATDQATNTFDTRTRGDIASAAARTGSPDSSMAQLLLSRGESDLAASNATLTANLGVAGEQQQSTELTSALGQLISAGNLGVNEQGGAAQSISQLLSTAKGGQTSTTADATTASQMIQQMLQGATTATSGGSTSASDTSNVGFSTNNTVAQQVTDLLNNAAQATVGSSNTNTTTNTTADNSGSLIDILKLFAGSAGHK